MKERFSRLTRDAINEEFIKPENNMTPAMKLEFNIRQVEKRLKICPTDLKLGYEIKLQNLKDELQKLKYENE